MTGGAKAIVGLAEAVESLRAELMTAVEAGRNQPMQFSVEPIELTAQVAVTKEANGKIGCTCSRWAVRMSRRTRRR
jgi:NTP-dependent ternary system trypsin peptidase co-occuring protein